MENYKPLLRLAREAIKSGLEGTSLAVSDLIKKQFSKKLACFVTLTLGGELRGCIGSLEARQELWADVVSNARSAAFNDSRFPELTNEDFANIKIELSVLSPLKKITYKNENELKNKIRGRGVLIKKGFYSATYLPQVWNELPSFEKFISSLCLKAGLNARAWQDNLEVWIYDVSLVKE